MEPVAVQFRVIKRAAACALLYVSVELKLCTQNSVVCVQLNLLIHPGVRYKCTV